LRRNINIKNQTGFDPDGYSADASHAPDAMLSMLYNQIVEEAMKGAGAGLRIRLDDTTYLKLK